MFAIFGSNLASEEATASAPLPLTLAGTSVTINGIPAPLSFVSPGQINAEVPSSLTAPDHQIIAVAILVTTPAGSAGIQTGLASGAPGLFTADSSGCGQAAALNIRPDGAVSVNSASNSAAPGDYVALFGTGFGAPLQQVDDGSATTGPLSIRVTPGVTVDGAQLDSLAYAGLAPGYAGPDQINFQVPATTRNGCAVPVTGSQGLGSPKVTISVQNGRGQCTDPPIQSYGSIGLNFAATLSSTDFFYASFPAGPNVTPPAPQKIIYSPNFGLNDGGISLELSAFPFSQRSCVVPGYTNLSAGTIEITPPSGAPVTFTPSSDGAGGVVYGGSLPAGFVAPGVYTVAGANGAPVGLNAKFTVGSPIQLQTAFPPGTVISFNQPLTIRWTGGDPDALVRLTLTSSSPVGGSRSSYTYGHATDGSLTLTPVCTFGHALFPSICGFGIPESTNGSITVEVMPDPAKQPAVTVPGVTAPVSLGWSYAYGFQGLVLQ